MKLVLFLLLMKRIMTGNKQSVHNLKEKKERKTVFPVLSIKSSVLPKLQDHESCRLSGNKEAVFPPFSFMATFCSAARQLRNQSRFSGLVRCKLHGITARKAFFDLPS